MRLFYTLREIDVVVSRDNRNPLGTKPVLHEGASDCLKLLFVPKIHEIPCDHHVVHTDPLKVL